MPNITDIAADFRDTLINLDNAAIGTMTRRWLGVEVLLTDDVEKLVKQIQAMKLAGDSPTQIKEAILRLDIYKSLLAQIGQHLTAYNRATAPEIEETSASSRNLAQTHAAGYIDAVSNGRVTITPDNLPIGAVENIAAIARAGQPLNTLLQNAYPTSVQGITNELIYGTAVGRNPRETARTIIRKGMAPGLNHILLVARDQQIRNYREMTRTIYDDSDVVSGYVRLAAKNTRTCLACLALDGTVYETSELMAIHPTDRCSIVPIVKGFPSPSFQTGEEWFRKQSPAVQKKMMGRERYQMWQNGRLPFGRLVTVVDNETWGPSAQVTAVGDLRKGLGGVERDRI